MVRAYAVQVQFLLGLRDKLVFATAVTERWPI